ncbi:MAG: hypothetical protein ACRD1X_17905 [Vicinamibacteria bacterium]
MRTTDVHVRSCARGSECELCLEPIGFGNQMLVRTMKLGKGVIEVLLVRHRGCATAPE